MKSNCMVSTEWSQAIATRLEAIAIRFLQNVFRKTFNHASDDLSLRTTSPTKPDLCSSYEVLH